MSDESAADKLKGRAKEAAGKVTGDKRLEGEGEADQAKGKAKEAVEKAKGAVDSLTGDDDRDH
ncbi:CsbD family protein [Yinghuangia seranimata]|uniref:CsbD family protein n=1 Tax=Yinghuangia seranimata TaxID=408067 RepID=UPI00248C7B9E|nr:CsbD family protein [Yinghuangia seranimata]MDI2128298.1 CsbD family protein [Yinghuangia seranimata]